MAFSPFWALFGPFLGGSKNPILKEICTSSDSNSVRGLQKAIVARSGVSRNRFFGRFSSFWARGQDPSFGAYLGLFWAFFSLFWIIGY